MANRGFSGTTLVLVVILLGALFGVGHLVNPPPPGPDPEKAAPEQVTPTTILQKAKGDPKERARLLKQYTDKMQAMQAKGIKAPSNPSTRPLQDPGRMDISSGYFTNHAMGAKGVEQTDAEYAKQKAAYEKWKVENAKLQKAQQAPPGPITPGNTSGAMPSGSVQ